MGQFDFPVLGGLWRGLTSLNPNGAVYNQTDAQQAGANMAIGANQAVGSAMGQYRPGQNAGAVNNAMTGNLGAAQQAMNTAQQQNTASQPGFAAQQQNIAQLQQQAANGNSAALQQQQQGQQQAAAQQGAQQRSTFVGSQALMGALGGQQNAAQGQANGQQNSMLRAQTQLQAQQQLGQATGQYGNSVNDAYSSAQQGAIAGQQANLGALGTQASYLNGAQTNNQNYLNTVGGIGNQGYQNANDYQAQQQQYLGGAAKTGGAILGGVLG